MYRHIDLYRKIICIEWLLNSMNNLLHYIAMYSIFVVTTLEMKEDMGQYYNNIMHSTLIVK
jgi:hypothetical protein